MQREQFNSYVEPDTAAYARDERERTGRSIGAIIDSAIRVYAMKNLTYLRLRIQEQLAQRPLTSEDLAELESIKVWIEFYTSRKGG